MAPAGYGNRVEGLHSVAAAAARGRVRKLWVEEKRLGRAEVADIVNVVGRASTALVDDVRPMAETEAPQGVVAECVPIMPVPVDDLADPEAAVVVLDHIEDPHNVGAIARSALASGMTGMVVSSRRAAPLSATAFKAAAGALETLPGGRRGLDTRSAQSFEGPWRLDRRDGGGVCHLAVRLGAVDGTGGDSGWRRGSRSQRPHREAV